MNQTNPYYSPDPFLIQWPVKILVGITTIIAITYIYTVSVHSPKIMSWQFRGMLIYHCIIAAFQEILIGVLAWPNMAFPYVAVQFRGLFTQMGVSQLFQAELVVSSTIVAMTAVCALFYYRLELLLPPNHFLKKPVIRIFIYAITYPILSFINFPVMYLFFIQDQVVVKEKIFNEFHVTYPNIFNDYTLAAEMSTQNPGFWVAVIIFPLFGVHFSFMLNYSCYKIYSILKDHNERMSDVTRHHHISVVKSMGGLFVCFLFVLGAMFVPILLMMYHQSWRSDLFVIAVFNGVASIPIIYSTQLATYKPYRQAILSFFGIKQHDSSALFVNTVSVSINAH